MRCPSSPLSEFVQDLVTQTNQLQPSYVGISGGTDHFGEVKATRIQSCCVGILGGHLSSDGMLVVNDAVRMSEATDGTSNILCVGEASGWLEDVSGKRFRGDAGFPNGWMTGSPGMGTPPSYSGGMVGPFSLQPRGPFNVTTIQHSPNALFDTSKGMAESGAPNKPLSSAHPGGVQGALLDGKVQFISENINRAVLKRYAVRDDGEPVPAF